MPKGIRYDDGFIVGGNLNTRVTPNFRLREFARPNGDVHVHRELVGALQELRERYGKSLEVKGLNAKHDLGGGKHGLFVWLGTADPGAVVASAAPLNDLGYFALVRERGGQVYAEMPPPEALPPLPAEPAFEIGMRLTAAYETSGDPYQQVTGNFDGAGLSFGPLQINFKSGTLKELFARFQSLDAASLSACFARLDHFHQWQQILHSSQAKQIAWADGLSRGSSKHSFAQPWKGYLQAVGRVTTFREETLRYAYDTYGRKLIVQLAWLRGLSPIRIDHFACLSALYDLCVQQGGLERAHTAIRNRVENESPSNQFELVHIAVEERGHKANERWRADCVSRRLGILYRSPQRITESGQTAHRDNPRLYLVRNVKVKGVEGYLT